MINKAALDRYIEGDPGDDGYSGWSEQVVDSFSQGFYDNWYYWIDAAPTCDKWMEKLFDNETEPELAAQIIERAHKLYINR